jgi:colanic acid biosynthesis glycosyl transferase WcaI
MKICFFNRSYWPDHGATGQLLTELAEDLVARHGFEVTVVCGEAPGSARTGRLGVRHERRNGVEILRGAGTNFDKARFAGRAANYLSYFASALLAGRRIGRPDVVVALTDPPIIGLAARRAARRSGARFVHFCQDVFPEVTCLVEDFRSGLVDGVLERVSRSLIGGADHVVAVGETMRDLLVQRRGAHPVRVAVIHNWADCSALTPRAKDNPFARLHGLSEPFVVMHSGNVGLSQDLDTLLDAARLLSGERGIVFVVMGDGARRGALEARARSEGLGQVRFLPHQPKEGLADAFGSADIFVVSLKRGLAGSIVPSKLYGILAAGRPYVAAVEPFCEVASITTKHDCGLLVAPGDARALADRILELYGDRQLIRHLSDNARRAAFAFDRPLQVDAHARLLRDVAATAAAPRPSRLKRVFDVSLAGLGLLLSAPLWAAIALAVKTGDGGPIFYGQERVGLGGRRFKSWKFRSMVPDADRRWGPLQASENDRRITPVGRLLRKTAMDELPQLWNIFVGDMSFVGPRALLPAETESRAGGTFGRLEDVPGYEARHSVRPGLTGLAQVFAPRDVPRRQKFRYDLLYIRRRSFRLDLGLVALSFWITFRGRWEQRGRKV